MKSEPALKYLFSPITLGQMEVKNRLVMPPMSVNFGVDEAGFVTGQHTEYLAARARSGTGMIVIGGGAVHPSGLDLPRMPYLWSDRFIKALQKLTDRIHQYDVKLGMQLLHGGRQAYLGEKVAPSPLPSLAVVKGVPRELTLMEIEELILSFGDAAGRCREAGFDFVEIHAAHGYLISEFLAPNANRREDQYGGSFENRIRFLLGLFDDIKAKAGQDFPVGVRLNGQDYVKDGWTMEDAKAIAPILEGKGADWLHVSAGVYGSLPVTIPSMYAEHGCFLNLAEQVKARVHIPIIAVGRIKDPVMADQIIRQGRADMVAMGRAHLADPQLAKKAFQGNLADIRPCLGCCRGCIQQVLALEEATCVMNPEVGREYLLKNVQRAGEPKRVLVMGAGPSGLAVARMAALRGHRVIIAEEKGRLGGMAQPASKPPGRSEIQGLIQYYQRELEKLGVEIRLNVKLDQALIAALNPDVAVIATGSMPAMPQIEGLFDTDMQVHTVLDILAEKVIPGDRIIVLGGNMLGLQVADFLEERYHKEVFVLHRYGHFAEEMAPNDRIYLMERLKIPHISLFKKVTIKKFLRNGVVFRVDKEDVVFEDMADIVIAEARRSLRDMADLFKDSHVHVYTIGDAKDPGTLLESQAQADEVGRAI